MTCVPTVSVTTVNGLVSSGGVWVAGTAGEGRCDMVDAYWRKWINTGPVIVWVCDECCNPDIEVQVWININTDEVTGDAGDGVYCPWCEAHDWGTRELTAWISRRAGAWLMEETEEWRSVHEEV